MSVHFMFCSFFFSFFFNDTATTEIYTLSLHDALPIFEHTLFYDAEPARAGLNVKLRFEMVIQLEPELHVQADRKSTRLNSSHRCISYAVFCLKKKKKKKKRKKIKEKQQYDTDTREQSK